MNIPHMGFSRKKMAKLFDNYENCFTDIAGLKPYIKKSPEKYIAFIEHYHDRVMFGTDCPWNEAGEVVRFLDLIEPLPFKVRTRKNLLYNNAMKFLGL